MGENELTFVKKNLNDQEQLLFFAMDLPTQTHCFRVAQTCLKLSINKSAVNTNLLIKAALLHDIGKPANVIRTSDRIIIVLVSTLMLRVKFYILKMKHSKLQLFRAFQAHYKHPLVGGILAQTAQLPQELIYLIENHHKEITAIDSLELQLLRKADQLN